MAKKVVVCSHVYSHLHIHYVARAVLSFEYQTYKVQLQHAKVILNSKLEELV